MADAVPSARPPIVAGWPPRADKHSATFSNRLVNLAVTVMLACDCNDDFGNAAGQKRSAGLLAISLLDLSVWEDFHDLVMMQLVHHTLT